MDFDEFAEGYSQRVDRAVGFSGQTQAFFLDVKAHQLEATIRGLGAAATLRALEVGCGTGLLQQRLEAGIAHLVGLDPSLGSLARARHARTRAALLAADGRRLPFGDGGFDLVFAVCVLHHIRPGDRDEVVAEMARVTRSGGAVVLWEHNPWNPLTRRVVARCAFDRDAVLVSRAEAKGLLRRAGLSRIEADYSLFFPWQGQLWRKVEQLLARVPFGAQFVALGTKD